MTSLYLMWPILNRGFAGNTRDPAVRESHACFTHSRIAGSDDVLLSSGTYRYIAAWHVMMMMVAWSISVVVSSSSRNGSSSDIKRFLSSCWILLQLESWANNKALISRVAVLLFGFLDLITTEPCSRNGILAWRKKGSSGVGCFTRQPMGFGSTNHLILSKHC